MKIASGKFQELRSAIVNAVYAMTKNKVFKTLDFIVTIMYNALCTLNLYIAIYQSVAQFGVFPSATFGKTQS